MKKLTEDRCYEFKIDLRHASDFNSGVRRSKNRTSYKEYSFGNPICLNIGLSNESCDISQDIFASDPISNTEWASYSISFKPDRDYDHIYMKATYCEEESPYNGNIMIDNISNFREVECPAKDD